MASVEILAIGTELLLGQLLDTNTAHIAAAMAENGVDVYATHALGDNRARIAQGIRAALDRADGVITSGGLGPTVDDLTTEAVCDVMGVDTQWSQAAFENIEAIFARSGRRMRDNNRKQAQVPRGCVVLLNDNGSAPGFIAVRADAKFVASLPGVPHEMKPMLARQVLPWLRERFDLQQTVRTRVLHTIDLAESEVDHRIDDLFRTLDNPKIAVLAHDFRCDVKIMAKAASAEGAEQLIVPVETEIARRLRGHVFGADDRTLPESIHALLQRVGLTLAAAESCTGGSVCAALTSVAGSSKSFKGGVVAYDNAVKRDMLDVSAQMLQRAGAVSEETALAMAQGIRARLNADVGLSTTGIAGPDGGSTEKPVGLVWIGLADSASTLAVRLQLPGGRTAVQARATASALAMLWKRLSAWEPNAAGNS